MKLEALIGVIVISGLLLVGVLYFSSSGKNESNTNTISGEVLTLEQKSLRYSRSIDISSPDGFINTAGQPITLEELKGKKVVLLDIWTYSCINCQRTLPYLNDWYKKYQDQGLEIIGLHTPEFAFEKVQSNVEEAVKRFGIKYPVVLDNDFSTWRAYGNQYWPRKYLIDIDGFVVYDHIGEGGYEKTERAIQHALKERNLRLGLTDQVTTEVSNPDDKITVDATKLGSPEIYFGSDRNRNLANGPPGVSGKQQLIGPEESVLNQLYLVGDWDITPEYAQNKGGGSILFKYQAKDVYLVASGNGSTSIEVWLDGQFQKTIMVDAETLYEVVLGADYGEHLLELKIKSPGLKAFTFTFG